MPVRLFEWCLQVRGTAIGAWPAAERTAALELLESDAHARALLAQALDVEDAGPEQAGDQLALTRMRRHLGRQLALRATAAPALRWGVRGGALAACLVAGLWAGGLMDVDRDPLANVQVAALDALF